MTTTIMAGFEALWAKIGGGSGFTFDEILAQASSEQLAGENFFITHHDERYMIPKEAVEAYFQTHARPGGKMSREEEKAALLHRISELESLVANLRQSQVKPAPAAPAMVSSVEDAPAKDDSGDSLFDCPDVHSPDSAANADYKKDLEKSLKGKQPLRANK
jgi:hypothetical protein